MAEQNARQRMKLLPSTESHSQAASHQVQPTVQYFKAGQTNFFKGDQGSDEGNQEETIGDGANIHHGPSYESNQELQE